MFIPGQVSVRTVLILTAGRTFIRRIRISAGYDGLYGISDDVCNVTWKYRE
ncbi:MAG: hypothetical protein QM570_08975 [Planctomycetota bacterium]|nr:hypothetical protein [Planctomycetota bacterium]